MLDADEWKNAFGNVETTDSKLVIKSTAYCQWENSLEATKIATCIARNRKVLQRKFIDNSTHSNHNGDAKYVTFDQAKRAL